MKLKDLQCCANCEYHTITEVRINGVILDKKFIEVECKLGYERKPNDYCNNWEYDELTSEERS